MKLAKSKATGQILHLKERRKIDKIIINAGVIQITHTRCVRKVSDLRLYLRARALDWPLRSMSVTSSPSRTP